MREDRINIISFHLMNFILIILINFALFKEFLFIVKNPPIELSFPGSENLPGIVLAFLEPRLAGYEIIIGMIIVFIVPVLYGFMVSYYKDINSLILLYVIIAGICIISFEYIKWVFFLSPSIYLLKASNMIILCRIIVAYCLFLIVGYLFGGYLKYLIFVFAKLKSKKEN